MLLPAEPQTRAVADAMDGPRRLPAEPTRVSPEALGPYGSWPWVERRHNVDRRASGGTLQSLKMLGGRRARGRRRGESMNRYVERFTGEDLALALTILGLNVADAAFTLIYLDAGGTEANPFAQKLLDMGTPWFSAVKALMIALCLLVLTLHKNFRGVRFALRGLFVFYLILTYYHLYLHTR